THAACMSCLLQKPVKQLSWVSAPRPVNGPATTFGLRRGREAPGYCRARAETATQQPRYDRLTQCRLKASLVMLEWIKHPREQPFEGNGVRVCEASHGLAHQAEIEGHGAVTCDVAKH